MHEILLKMHDSWPFELVGRSHVGKFSHGSLNPRTCANRDSAGTWNVRKLKIGTKVYYHKADLIAYLATQMGVEWDQAANT